MGRKDRDEDAGPATGVYRYPPWWKRIYFEKRTLLIALGLGVLGLAKIALTGTLLD